MAGPYFSNHYNNINTTTGVGYDARATGQYIAPTNYGETNIKVKKARVVLPAGADLGGDGDIIWLFDIKSGDCPYEMWVSCDANMGATSTFNIGLYESSTTSTIGTLIDEDIYGAEDISAKVTRVDSMTTAGGLLDEHRGYPAWEQAAIGAASYTEDPHETWTIAATATGAIAATDGICVISVEMWYGSTS